MYAGLSTRVPWREYRMDGLVIISVLSFAVLIVIGALWRRHRRSRPPAPQPEPETDQMATPASSTEDGESHTVDDKHIVRYPACPGTLSWDEDGKHHETVIQFTLEVDNTGRIRLIVDDQPLTSANFWIKRASSGSSTTVAALTLVGRDPDGRTIQSDTVHLTSTVTSSTPSSATLTMSASALRLTILPDRQKPESATEYQARYMVAGLRWFLGTKFDTSAGEVAIKGNVEENDYSAVSGIVAIRSPAEDKTLGQWLAEADAQVRRILDIVSFADGHFMRATVREAFRDEELARIDFLGSGQGSSPHKSPLHWLNYNQSLPALIRAYDADLIKRTGLDVAIEWHVMPHVYDEARFVAQMTAIEHLIDVFSEHSPDSTYIDKRSFNKAVAPVLIRALEQEVGKLGLVEAVRSEAVEGMTRTLRGMNRRSLRSNLTRMLREYHVPMDGLDDLVAPLINTRNDIVHRGFHDRGDDGTRLSQRVAEAEELLRRIVLSILKFQGRYTTWLDKHEDLDFQPQEKTKAESERRT